MNGHHGACLVGEYTVRQVGDAEWRCNGCNGDQERMERAEEALRYARSRCQQTRWPELHDDHCEFCAYVAAGGPVCRYDREPLLEEQERTHGICRACWDEGTSEASYG